MLFTWFSVGVAFMLVVRAILTPFATMLPAALTRLTAEAFCSAAPARSTLYELVTAIFELSTATFSAAAEAIAVAPCTVSITWLFFTSLLVVVSAICKLMLATVLLEALLDLLML